MIDWPIGLSTGSFYQRSVFECMEPVVQHGFCMVELSSSPEHLDYHDKTAVKDAAFMLRRMGVETYSFHAPFAKDINFASIVESERDSAREELFSAVEAAAEFEARYFVLHAGPDKGLSSDPAERNQELRNAALIINSVCEKCLENGLIVVLENLLPSQFPGGVQDLLWLLGAVSYANIGTCFDTGHAFISGDIVHYLRRMKGQVCMIHADDNGGVEDDHLPIAEGAIDWMKLVSEIAHAGFNGGIILELAGEGADLEAQLARAVESRQLLRTIFRTLSRACLQPAEV